MAKMERVAEDDPLRCQAVYAHGQCPYKRMEHTEYCIMHGGAGAQHLHNKKCAHDYKLQVTEWKQRVDELAGSANVKNLRGEIGILRMTLEHILNQIKTPVQFPIFADKIQSVARDLKGLVETCQKMEERNRELLSKTEVFNIADAVIQIISDFITDPDDLMIVGEKLYDAIIGIASGENPGRNRSQDGNGSEPLGVQVPSSEPPVPRSVDL